MRRVRAPAVGLLLLCVLAFGVTLTGRRPADPPRLTVLIVVDQLRFDYLTRFQDLYQGGFRRLLEQGAFFTEARYRHALTLTGPGHAAIVTGLHPSHTGVVGNDWYDPYGKKAVNCIGDPDYEPVGGPGRRASPRSLLTDTLGDRLKRRYPDARVVGLSTKDRSAILLAGRKGDAAYWYSDACGCFITSSYYMKEPSGWLTSFNHSKPADTYLRKPWERWLDDASLYESRSRTDAFEGELDTTGTAFPHPVRSYRELRRSPYSDELLMQAALSAMKSHEMGVDKAPDLLAISFSSTDYVGHDYGPFSQESMDQHLRLDAVLGRFFEALDAHAGPEHVTIALTADHGVAPTVSHSKRQGLDAKSVPFDALPGAVTAAVAKEYPELGDIVAYFDRPHLFLDLSLLKEHNAPRSRVESIAKEALLATGFVEHVYTHDDLLSERGADPDYRQLYVNALYEQRSPHLIVRFKEFYFIENSGEAAWHGSPYEYDRHVPVLFMGAGIKPGRYHEPAGPEDIAPTLAALLGVKIPLESDARVLDAVFP